MLIGFTTHSGTVTAASNSDEPAECKRVRPALPGSYEALFHALDIPRFWLDLRKQNKAMELLREERLERAIGVIYRPETERQSHYFYARSIIPHCRRFYACLIPFIRIDLALVPPFSSLPRYRVCGYLFLRHRAIEVRLERGRGRRSRF